MRHILVCLPQLIARGEEGNFFKRSGQLWPDFSKSGVFARRIDRETDNALLPKKVTSPILAHLVPHSPSCSPPQPPTCPQVLTFLRVPRILSIQAYIPSTQTPWEQMGIPWAIMWRIIIITTMWNIGWQWNRRRNRQQPVMRVREEEGSAVVHNLVPIVQKKDVNAITLNNIKEERERHLILPTSPLQV